MPFQKNDILLALKVIALSDKLNGTEKQVAAALVDSYNRRTGRCDPSLETLSVWLGKSRRTVIRAVDRLVKLKFLRKIRHGGNKHCNFYAPQWEFYRSIEQSYRQRRKQYANRFGVQEVSPSNNKFPILFRGHVRRAHSQPVHPVVGEARGGEGA
jgi:hypothetical protein